MKPKSLMTYLRAEVYEELDKLAASSRLSKSYIVNESLLEFFKAKEKVKLHRVLEALKHEPKTKTELTNHFGGLSYDQELVELIKLGLVNVQVYKNCRQVTHIFSLANKESGENLHCNNAESENA